MLYVGIDIGGTAIKHGLLDEQGTIIEKSVLPTPPEGGPGILKATVQIVEQYRAAHELAGICISTAGMVDCDKGSIFYAGPTIPNYIGTQFKAVMEERFGLPCEVENDVNCAGLAEYISGAAKGSKVAVCLTVGTGIGGCAIVNGQVLHGCSGSAMEIGYLNMHGKTFETLGATSVLCQKVKERKGAASAEEWDGYHVFEAAKQGDKVCLEAIDEMCDVLGEGIANICYVLNPDTVVLGGGIMAQWELLQPRMEAALKRYLGPALLAPLRLAAAQHQNDAGILGALYHFQTRHQ